jgi:cellulose synthase/poly-beta-1,6-N-acetylglucosamine synthase-like glycosyltransferase
MSAESILIATVVICAVAAAYAYVGFPLLAVALARTRRERGTTFDDDPRDPDLTVTVIIPAYNEERSLDAKIRNVLAANYPRRLLEIIVVSDASTDGTNDIARSFEDDGVRLLVQEPRRGKTAGLNRAMTMTKGEIVVFTDANATYRSSTIARLVTHFSRPNVGLVSGYTRYAADDRGEVAETTNAYTSLERVIKTAESRWGCCVGADGAIFAMRRSLFQPLRDDDINDLVLPLRVIEQGYQCVFAADAFCIEPPGSSVDSEYRRQSRITNRTLRALWRHAHLLNPFRFGLFSFFLFSHKIVRFLVPFFLVLACAAIALLAGMRTLYLLAAAAIFLGMATAVGVSRMPALAWALPGRLLRQLGVFLTINAAVLEGWWSFLRGRRDVVWQHDRSRG